MKLINWNLNSLNARWELLETLLKNETPDVVLLQESRITEDNWVSADWDNYFKSLGYNSHLNPGEVHGHAGVLTLVKSDIPATYENVKTGRCTAMTVGNHVIYNVYINQGREIDHEEYFAKQTLLNTIINHRGWESIEYPIVSIIGDFNICPEDIHVWSTTNWHEGVVSRTPRELEWFNSLLSSLNLTNIEPTEGELMTWYGYRQAWRKLGENNERIDHSFKYGVKCDHACTNHSNAVVIVLDQYRFGVDRPSDHIPMLVEFN